MRKLFGAGKKKQTMSSQEEALAKLRASETMLLKKIDFVESRIDAQLKIAMENKTKNKRLAINALRNKKRFEEQLKSYEGMLNTVYMQIDTLESSQTTVEVAKSVQSATVAMKTAHTKLNVNKISDIVDDMQEEHDKALEMSEALANMGGLAPVYDEDELLGELDDLNELENQQLQDIVADAEINLNDLPSVPQKLPDVPIVSQSTNTPTKKKVAVGETNSTSNQTTTQTSNKEIEDELNKLLDWS